MTAALLVVAPVVAWWLLVMAQVVRDAFHPLQAPVGAHTAAHRWCPSDIRPHTPAHLIGGHP